MTFAFPDPAVIIANELNIKPSRVEAAIQLLDEGATVPFIARYRKEATEGLDDTQLRTLVERLTYLRELHERRDVILASIREQGLLSPDLEAAIAAADTKNRLEDLYLPYRPKRRTKAQIAKEAGLEPLATALRDNPDLVPEVYAQSFLNAETGVETIQVALDGARQILMAHVAEHANLLDNLREYLWQHAVLTASLREPSKTDKNKKTDRHKFQDFANFQEPIRKIPSHRALALFRGRRDGFLQLSLVLSESIQEPIQRIAAFCHVEQKGRAADDWLCQTLDMAWKLKIFPKLELELFARLRDDADEEAIRVFARNLKGLLLAAPAGHQVTIGLDPGIRTGVKMVVVDRTGKLLDEDTIFPFPPHNDQQGSIASLAKMAMKHHAQLISIGNGTGSRETERLVQDMMKIYPDLHVSKVLVNEAGASVYSASALAAEEFPDLDVSLRGAVSIARRLQDPLAELVKIEPKSIGVGQYQHDVNQSKLSRSLDGVVEDCVNAVGVDVNTASVSLLKRVAGLNEAIAKNLIQYRDEHGAFSSRENLKNVPRMGEKTFQQSAGFLRIVQGDNPLDASAVHPEAYPLVEKIAANQQVDIRDMIGNTGLLKTIAPEQYCETGYGLPTIRDVLRELEKPGRDPRPTFKTIDFKEGVETIADLAVGMVLDGIVSNVTNFGAFINIGVHQDGLVHISELTRGFVSDPHTIVKAGDIVKVKVIEVEQERKRIGLSMKLDETKPKPPVSTRESVQSAQPFKTGQKRSPSSQHAHHPQRNKAEKIKTARPVANTAMADAFAKLKREI